jgi:hypothetical protein
MAASNADATKGILMLHHHDYTIQLSFATSHLARMLTDGGYGALAMEAIRKGWEKDGAA